MTDWSTPSIVWAVLGCTFAPIYLTALICSIVRICRDRRRILKKNEMIRRNRDMGITPQSSVKRPNIEIIQDEDRARRFRAATLRGTFGRSKSTDVDARARSRATSTNVDGPMRNGNWAAKMFNKNKSNTEDDSTNSNNIGLANGHTAHVTIEHCDKQNTDIALNHLNVHGRPNEDPTSDGYEIAGSEGSDSLAIATPSDAGSSLANTDTEIICDSLLPSNNNNNNNNNHNSSGDRIRHHSRSENSTSPNSNNVQRQRAGSTGKTQPHKQPCLVEKSESNRDLSTDCTTRALLDGDNEMMASKGYMMSPERELYGANHVRNRRISSGLVQEEEEKIRKDQEYRMAVMRSKSEDNVRSDSGDNSLFVHEQGKENLAFERSTENTRM